MGLTNNSLISLTKVWCPLCIKMQMGTQIGTTQVIMLLHCLSHVHQKSLVSSVNWQIGCPSFYDYMDVFVTEFSINFIE